MPLRLLLGTTMAAAYVPPDQMIISGGLSDEGVHRDWWLLSLVEHVWTEITVIILNQYGVIDCVDIDVDSGRAVVSRFPVVHALTHASHRLPRELPMRTM